MSSSYNDVLAQLLTHEELDVLQLLSLSKEKQSKIKKQKKTKITRKQSEQLVHMLYKHGKKSMMMTIVKEVCDSMLQLMEEDGDKYCTIFVQAQVNEGEGVEGEVDGEDNGEDQDCCKIFKDLLSHYHHNSSSNSNVGLELELEIMSKICTMIAKCCRHVPSTTQSFVDLLELLMSILRQQLNGQGQGQGQGKVIIEVCRVIINLAYGDDSVSQEIAEIEGSITLFLEIVRQCQENSDVMDMVCWAIANLLACSPEGEGEGEDLFRLQLLHHLLLVSEEEDLFVQVLRLHINNSEVVTAILTMLSTLMLNGDIDVEDEEQEPEEEEEKVSSAILYSRKIYNIPGLPQLLFAILQFYASGGRRGVQGEQSEDEEEEAGDEGSSVIPEVTRVLQHLTSLDLANEEDEKREDAFVQVFGQLEGCCVMLVNLLRESFERVKSTGDAGDDEEDEEEEEGEEGEGEGEVIASICSILNNLAVMCESFRFTFPLEATGDNASGSSSCGASSACSAGDDGEGDERERERSTIGGCELLTSLLYHYRDNASIIHAICSMIAELIPNNTLFLDRFLYPKTSSMKEEQQHVVSVLIYIFSTHRKDEEVVRSTGHCLQNLLHYSTAATSGKRIVVDVEEATRMIDVLFPSSQGKEKGKGKTKGIIKGKSNGKGKVNSKVNGKGKGKRAESFYHVLFSIMKEYFEHEEIMEILCNILSLSLSMKEKKRKTRGLLQVPESISLLTEVLVVYLSNTTLISDVLTVLTLTLMHYSSPTAAAIGEDGEVVEGEGVEEREGREGEEEEVYKEVLASATLEEHLQLILLTYRELIQSGGAAGTAGEEGEREGEQEEKILLLEQTEKLLHLLLASRKSFLYHEVQEALETSGEIESLPREFFCPLTKKLLIDPVVLVSDGSTYERKAIEELSLHQQGNHERLVSTSMDYMPNESLRCMIEDFVIKKKQELVEMTKKVSASSPTKSKQDASKKPSIGGKR